jgi:hypothetical protein
MENHEVHGSGHLSHVIEAEAARKHEKQRRDVMSISELCSLPKASSRRHMTDSSNDIAWDGLAMKCAGCNCPDSSRQADKEDDL